MVMQFLPAVWVERVKEKGGRGRWRSEDDRGKL